MGTIDISIYNKALNAFYVACSSLFFKILAGAVALWELYMGFAIPLTATAAPFCCRGLVVVLVAACLLASATALFT